MKQYTGIKGKLDKLVGNYFRSKGKCECCGGRNGHIEWAHIKSRRYHSTRWELINCVTLDSKCHRHFTDHPDLFTRWLDEKFPRRIEKLNEIFRSVSTLKEWQYEEMYERIKKEIETINEPNYIYPSGEYEGGYH